VKIADILGKPLTVELKTCDEGDLRYFNGIVTRFCSTGWSGEFASYQATVHPWLWLLRRASNCRIFQDLAVPDIVKQVCQPYGGVVSLSASSLSGDYPALPYCVQYRETDFDFVCRLLEEAGIYFYFTHEADKHTMVLADSYGAHQPISGYEGLKFARADRSGAWSDEACRSWTTGGEIASSKYVLNDFDFEKATNSTTAACWRRRTWRPGSHSQPTKCSTIPATTPCRAPATRWRARASRACTGNASRSWPPPMPAACSPAACSRWPSIRATTRTAITWSLPHITR
jgi:type VI secretion system VgrG family protein